MGMDMVTQVTVLERPVLSRAHIVNVTTASVRRGSCIVLKRGLVPTRDSGRDIVMEVWKENTATVTIAGLDSRVKFTIH